MHRIFLPQGWFVPVTPGTQFVTLGGMVAADVHGKNHHADGSFGNHVRRLLVKLASGDVVECTPSVESDLFWATIGGMGLTGHILEVDFGMLAVPSPWIYKESRRVDNLDDMIAGLRTAAAEWPLTVGWIDCMCAGDQLGRGILMMGRNVVRKGEATPESRARFSGFCHEPDQHEDV
jgi:FAD/FMN-containing dehydrogenase